MTRRVPLKTVALPNEHGAWGFLLEPALLGLLLAPSWAGILMVVAAVGALLAQHPLSMALADWRRGQVYPRTRLAWTFALSYGSFAALALIASVMLANRFGYLLPALLAAPLAVTQLTFDSRNQGRALLPELAGATAIAALTACLALAGDWALWPALMLWLILAARNLPSILYVRTRLKLEYGRPVNLGSARTANILAVMLILILVSLGTLPGLVLAAFLVLLARALLGLSRYRQATPAKVTGMRELGFGLLLVLLTAAGYYLPL